MSPSRRTKFKRSLVRSAVPIQCEPDAADAISLRAKDGLLALPRVGLAVGGALLGTYDDLSIKVTDSLEIECSHATGPSFNLTAEEKKQAKDLIRGVGSTCVGWYFSKTRGEMTLSAADIALFEEFCPEPWQIAMLVQPSTVKPTRTLFLSRDVDGALQTHPNSEVTDREDSFAAALPTEKATAEPKPAIAFPRSGFTSILFAEPPVAETPALRTARRRGLFGILTGAALVIAVVAVLVAWPGRRYIQAPPLPLTLDLTDINNNLLIRWDRDSVSAAAYGLLSIKDGVQLSSFRLDRSQLESGVFSYNRHSKSVDASLIAGGNSAHATYFDVTPQTEAYAAKLAMERSATEQSERTAGNRGLLSQSQ
jgi:hypothetical protein